MPTQPKLFNFCIVGTINVIPFYKTTKVTIIVQKYLCKKPHAMYSHMYLVHPSVKNTLAAWREDDLSESKRNLNWEAWHKNMLLLRFKWVRKRSVMDWQFNAAYFYKQAHGDGVGLLILRHTWLSMNEKKNHWYLVSGNCNPTGQDIWQLIMRRLLRLSSFFGPFRTKESLCLICI